MSNDDRELKRITPFVIQIEIKFSPDERFSSYQLSATGKAVLDGMDTALSIYPLLSALSARWLCNLQFNVHIDANAIVPLVNKANKE